MPLAVYCGSGEEYLGGIKIIFIQECLSRSLRIQGLIIRILQGVSYEAGSFYGRYYVPWTESQPMVDLACSLWRERVLTSQIQSSQQCQLCLGQPMVDCSGHAWRWYRYKSRIR